MTAFHDTHGRTHFTLEAHLLVILLRDDDGRRKSWRKYLITLTNTNRNSNSPCCCLVSFVSYKKLLSIMRLIQLYWLVIVICWDIGRLSMLLEQWRIYAMTYRFQDKLSHGIYSDRIARPRTKSRSRVVSCNISIMNLQSNFFAVICFSLFLAFSFSHDWWEYSLPP